MAPLKEAKNASEILSPFIIMLIPTGNAEHQFLCTRDHFRASVQLEIDAIMSREEISPFRLAMAFDNLVNLIEEVRAVERASLIMCKEMPRCRTVLNARGYYGRNSPFLENMHKLQEHLAGLKSNLMRQYGFDQHWICRKVEVVYHYLYL
ncbi:unnamed protein product [Penicillium glandicola]